MRSLLGLIVAALLFSCEQKLSDNESRLLTSQSWIIDDSSEDKNDVKQVQTYRFVNDGTYSMEVGEMKAHGKWSWTKDGDIYLATEGITIHGQSNEFEKTFVSYIRIIELTDKNLRTIERHEDDSWDSAFVRQRNYIARSL